MINKNEWSLKTYTEKDVNMKILTIEQKQITEEQFVKLLAIKEDYEKSQYNIKPEILVKILNSKIKKQKEEDVSSLCSLCFQSVSSGRYWCKICGGITCKKCLIRQRELKDQTKTFFCQRCDSEYLKAMANITFFNLTEINNKTFLRLVKQLQSIEELLTIQKHKLINKGERNDDTKRLIQTVKNSSGVLEQNKIIKLQNQELVKKLQFGKNINKTLKRKLQLLKKKQRESFGTMSNNDEFLSEIEPPKIDLNITIQELRDSCITTQEPTNDKLSYMEKCKCNIY